MQVAHRLQECLLVDVTPMQPIPVNVDAAPMPSGFHAQAVTASPVTKFLFASGQIPHSCDGDLPSDVGVRVWINRQEPVATSRMDVSNPVAATTVLTSCEDVTKDSRIRQEVLGGHSAAQMEVASGILDECWLLETETVAAA